MVDLEFLTRLGAPTTLREVKESHLFDDWSLVEWMAQEAPEDEDMSWH